jgi:hypothetical protein
MRQKNNKRSRRDGKAVQAEEEEEERRRRRGRRRGSNTDVPPTPTASGTVAAHLTRTTVTRVPWYSAMVCRRRRG